MADPRRMALRSRSRTATATSGPGRHPASDGRVRHHRRPPGVRGRARQRHASAEELRRRAGALFGEPAGPAEPPGRVEPVEPAGERRESGQGPPGSGDLDETPRVLGGRPALAEPTGGLPDLEGDGVRAGEGVWRERAGSALRERMPLWLQTRCGLERRSVLALTVVLVVAAAFAVQHFWAGRTQSVRPPEVVRAAVPFGEGRRAGSPKGRAGRASPGCRTVPLRGLTQGPRRRGRPKSSWTWAARSVSRGSTGCPPARGWRTP